MTPVSFTDNRTAPGKSAQGLWQEMRVESLAKPSYLFDSKEIPESKPNLS
jgi:hypothetical protein